MRRNAFGSNGASVVSSSLTPARAERPKPSMRPPPIAAVAMRKLRREVETASVELDGVFISCLRVIGDSAQVSSRDAGSLFDRGADARVGAAAANIPGHRIVDVGVARFGVAG